MGNIVGEGFDTRIRNQVERRQQTHGSGYLDGTLRTNEQLAVLNNNTAWIKLMSSVSIDNLTAINNPTISLFKQKGDTLAKSFVLFNGTSKYNTTDGINYTTTQREGIDFENTLGGRDSVYGIGGSADFGLNPMMGITGIDVKHKNRGSIRTATVTVKAFNRTQFEIIDVLYMRLGFSVLLEWGNSMYFENNGTYIKDGGNKNSLIDDWFKDSNYIKFLEKIRSRALSSHGNYDAMLAKVSNYHWSFQKDGSYDITIDLVSMGDVIESLNAGKSPNGIESNTQKGEETPLGKRLEKAKDQSKWGAEFWAIYKQLYSPTSNNFIREDIGFDEQIQYICSADIYIKPGGGFSISKNENGGFLYVKLGKILHLLENKIVLTTDNTRTLTFDYDYKNNLIGIVKSETGVAPTNSTNNIGGLFLPNNMVINQMSYNPYKCVTLKNVASGLSHIGGTYLGLTNASTFHNDGLGFNENSNRFNSSMAWETSNTNIALKETYAPTNLTVNILANPTEEFDVKIAGTYYGQIMNILVNAEFVLDVVDDKTNKETGELPLIDFLKGILAGINESLGGINELDVFIDETENEVKIIDTNPLPNLDKLLKEKKLQSTSTTFNLYGYSKAGGESNFIHDFNLTTEITPALSTMITVAATSNKTVVGEDNTALSKINKGLSDRYKKQLTEETKPSPDDITIKVPPTPNSPEYNGQYQAWLKKYDSEINPATPTKNGQPLSALVSYNFAQKFGQMDGKADNVINDYDNDKVIVLSERVFDGRDIIPGYPKGIIDSEVGHIFNLNATQKEQAYLSAAYGLDNYGIPSTANFWETIQGISTGDWNKENIDTFSNSFKDINRKWNDLKGIGKNNPTFKSGFIPFNLSLTMDGLGGMKIYQKFNVDTDFMPSNYPSSIEFLIKNIQHTVKDNKWITKIESFCVSKPGSNVIPASTPSISSIGLGHKIIITSGYAKSSTSTVAAYQATIADGTVATQDITITFTDTLKNTSTPDPTPPLAVTITIFAGAVFGTATITFANAGTLKSSIKKSITFTDPTLTATYYLTLGLDSFVTSTGAARLAKYVYNKDAEYYLSDGSLTKTFGIKNYEKQQDGAGNDWGGTLQRAAVIQAVVEDHFGSTWSDKNFIPSFKGSQMKRNQLDPALPVPFPNYPYFKAKSGAAGDHHTGNSKSFALDFASKDPSTGELSSRGTEMYAYIMDWLSTSGNANFTDPKFRTEGTNGTVNIIGVGSVKANKKRFDRIVVDGYSYQILWQVGDGVHYHHVHVGIKKV